jgi:hypothetical protein
MSPLMVSRDALPWELPVDVKEASRPENLSISFFIFSSFLWFSLFFSAGFWLSLLLASPVDLGETREVVVLLSERLLDSIYFFGWLE